MHIKAQLGQENLLRMVRWMRWHCPSDTKFEIRVIEVWIRARYLSGTDAPHNMNINDWKFDVYAESASCHIRSDSQTTGLTLTTGVCESCMKRRGASNMNNYYDVTGSLSAVWKFTLRSISLGVWDDQGGGGSYKHSTYAWYPGVCR